MFHLCAMVLAAAPIAGAIPVTASSARAARLFEEGRTAVLDFDLPRGAKALHEAVAAEPEFPLALAWLGRAVPGTDGLVFAQFAKGLSAKLPELERMEIDALYAEKKGDEDRARKLKREIADAAPADWVAQVLAGTQAQSDRKSQAALLYLQRATALAPGRPGASIPLAHTYLGQGMLSAALDTSKKLVAQAPRDARAHDMLGEVFMRLDKLDEADASFDEATKLSPDAWMAFVGRAYVRFFRGHVAAAQVMLARAREAAQRAPAPAHRMVEVTIAWTHLAAGSGDLALHAIDDLEKFARTHGDDSGYAWAAVERAEMLLELGKRDQARVQIAEALQRSEKLSVEDANTLRRVAFWAAQRNALASGKKEEAAKAVQGLEALPAAPADSNGMREMLTAARAAQAIGTGHGAQAVALLSSCSRTNFRCQQEMVEAQTLVGNQQAADETRAWMATANVRDGLSQGDDPIYLYLRIRFGLPPRTGTP
jgi:tetratricopeptide (TPR) repeat protein